LVLRLVLGLVLVLVLGLVLVLVLGLVLRLALGWYWAGSGAATGGSYWSYLDCVTSN
jgi:hypothetical protein